MAKKKTEQLSETLPSVDPLPAVDAQTGAAEATGEPEASPAGVLADITAVTSAVVGIASQVLDVLKVFRVNLKHEAPATVQAKDAEHAWEVFKALRNIVRSDHKPEINEVPADEV